MFAVEDNEGKHFHFKGTVYRNQKVSLTMRGVSEEEIREQQEKVQ